MEVIPTNTQAYRCQMRKAVVLLSGGIDSTVALYKAKHRGFEPHALTIDYGQKNGYIEIPRAREIAISLRVHWSSVKIDLPNIIDSEMFTGSYGNIEKNRDLEDMEDKNTPLLSYIPARNLILISVAVSYAEYIDASDIFVGLYSEAPYPDANVKFVTAMERVANKATYLGKSGRRLKIHTFGRRSKLEVLLEGVSLGVDLANTFSCYAPTGNSPCGVCDACVIRREAFDAVGFDDPATLGAALNV